MSAGTQALYLPVVASARPPSRDIALPRYPTRRHDGRPLRQEIQPLPRKPRQRYVYGMDGYAASHLAVGSLVDIYV